MSRATHPLRPAVWGPLTQTPVWTGSFNGLEGLWGSKGRAGASKVPVSLPALAPRYPGPPSPGPSPSNAHLVSHRFLQDPR